MALGQQLQQLLTCKPLEATLIVTLTSTLFLLLRLSQLQMYNQQRQTFCQSEILSEDQTRSLVQ